MLLGDLVRMVADAFEVDPHVLVSEQFYFYATVEYAADMYTSAAPNLLFWHSVSSDISYLSQKLGLNNWSLVDNDQA